MAQVINIATAVKNSMLTPMRDAIDAGSGPGIIEIYTGTIPADPATAVTTQVKLGTLTFSDPCGTVAAGALTMSAITQDSSADATGTASWARIKDSNGTVVKDINISTTGGGATMQMNTTNIVIGGPIQISSYVLTL